MSRLYNFAAPKRLCVPLPDPPALASVLREVSASPTPVDTAGRRTPAESGHAAGAGEPLPRGESAVQGSRRGTSGPEPVS
jgi:hypothetical protein